jgi:hypothetical protein
MQQNYNQYVIQVLLVFIALAPTIFPEAIKIPVSLRIIFFIVALLMFLIYPILSKILFLLRKLPDFVLRIVTHPLTRVGLIVCLMFAVLAIEKPSALATTLLLALGIFAIYPIRWKPKVRKQLKDEFNKNLSNWETITGSPTIESDFGKPCPALGLGYSSSVEATNAFLVLKDFEITSGTIECDIYLEPNALVNIVFLADIVGSNFYMARYDSRGHGSTDGLLLKDQGPGANWRGFRMTKDVSNSKEWIHAKVEFSPKGIKMYKNNSLLIQTVDPIIFGGRIGIFNEVADAHVDNFSVRGK